MAPEQSSGETLFETDVYSFGIILFELLAGTVPFPLINKGEMARNAVMLAHMETSPPDVVSLRRRALPGSWSHDKQEKEMEVPIWLLCMIDKCLEKEPARRFKNGSELQEFIHLGTVSEERKKGTNVSEAETAMLQTDESTWKKEILTLQTQLAGKEELLKDLQYLVDTRDRELIEAQYYNATKRNGISKSLFFVVLIFALGLAGFAAYNRLYHPPKNIQIDNAVQSDQKLPATPDSTAIDTNKPIKKARGKLKKNTNMPFLAASHRPRRKLAPVSDSTSGKHNLRPDNEYTILHTAYFYEAPDKNKRSDIYLTPGDATLTLTDESGEFRYAIFTDDKGKAIKGWLLKKDFIPASDY